MSVRYIGSKARVIEAIAPFIGSPPKRGGVFVDGFCGTGVVAEAAARRGWNVHLNDHLACAVTMAAARVTPRSQAQFRDFGGYASALDQLNAAPDREGFIWREYTPQSQRRCGVARMYFTERNARRIDGVRKKIGDWRRASRISATEERLLLADLLAATNKVANIAGTYGCFMSHWLPQSQQALALQPRALPAMRARVTVSEGDVADLEVGTDDLVYLDPPYTKRQYAAYYHVLETITVGDEPTVEGITGLRPWQAKASDFCYRSRALDALASLIDSLKARRVLLSYSDEGHVPLKPLTQRLSSIGRLEAVPLMEIGRYRPNRAASSARDAVTEYLLVLERPELTVRQRALA
ncbi:MAG: DNA adenine methylase [Myxococcus sp.]|nr:DNA adenine methylase [Myxococcus sp.]